MRKRIRIILFLIMALSVVFAFTACSESLSTPLQIMMDDEYNLSWRSVPNARNYTIQVKNVSTGKADETTTSRTSASLANLEEGDYEVRVKANSITSGLTDSKWSAPVTFTKEFESGAIYQLINSGTEYRVLRSGSATGEVLIEDYRRGKPVTEIGAGAFRGNTRVTSVIVGANVKKIGASAFSNCNNMTSITLPDGLEEIGEGAFKGCQKLAAITLPEGVTEIQRATFSYCRSLTEFVIGENVKSIADEAFTVCSSLESITIPDNVEYIGEHAFSSCVALKTAYIGSGVKQTGDKVFYGDSALETVEFSANNSLTAISESCFGNCSKLNNVAIPEGVESIETSAFSGCSALDNVTIASTVKAVRRRAFSATKLYIDQNTAENESGFIYADKWLIGHTAAVAVRDTDDDGNQILDSEGNEVHGITSLDPNSFKEGLAGFADYSLSGMGSLRSATLPTSVKYLGEYAFSGCPFLNNFTVRIGNLKDIGTGAFFECTKLSAVTFPNGLETIGHFAFFGCTNLDQNQLNPSAVIPSTVTRVGRYAFYDTAVRNADTPDGPVYFGNWMVDYVSSDSGGLGYTMGGVTQVAIEPNTVGISDYCLYRADMLESITGMDSVRYIGMGAFWGCENLRSISLGSAVREIKDYTFSTCTDLFQIELPDNLRSVGEGAFFGCASLSSVDFSSTRLETIGDRAFIGCTNLKTIDLGATYRGEYTLTNIGDRAFYGCISLGMQAAPTMDENGDLIEPPINVVFIPGSVETIPERAFYGCSSLESLQLGDGVRNVSTAAFARNSSLSSLITPSSLVKIDDNAFYRCRNLELLVLNRGLRSIGDYAFEGSALKSLVIPTTVREMGNYAFRRSSKLISVVIPSTVAYIDAGAFFDCKIATIYTDATQKPSGWNPRYNSSFRPVVYGSILNNDKTYVLAVDLANGGVENAAAEFGITQPKCSLYAFVGWATEENGEVKYSANEIGTIDQPITLYAVWSNSIEAWQADFAADNELYAKTRSNEIYA